MKMKLKTSVAGAVDFSGKWSIGFPVHDGFKLNVVLKGECWVLAEGSKAKHHIQAGDCYLSTGGRSIVVASDLSTKKSISFETLLKLKKNGVMKVNGGGEGASVSIYFQFDGHLSKVLFSHLPPVIHVPGHLDQAAILRWSVERFAAEFRNQNAGSSLIMNHLATIMLVQILRLYMASNPKEKNWLIALSDTGLSKVIDVMHAEYRRPWSLEEFAKIAGLSRSGFALNFKKAVGIAPMDYLTNWRMQIACELLQAGNQNIATIANAVGYESESAFSTAFKKILKTRPGVYQRYYKQWKVAPSVS
jgi:AraC-like DNA-binding protein